MNPRKKIRLGDLMVTNKLISQMQLEEALTDQKKSGRKLGRILIENGYVTENQMLEVLSTHPSVSIDTVQENTAFEIILARDYHQSEPPSDEELRLLRDDIDPLGIRRLEFIPSKDRTALIDELLTSEENAMRDILGTLT